MGFVTAADDRKTEGLKMSHSTVAQYVDSLEGIPLPSQQQRENFAKFIASAHSWYKHLPLWPPGVAFYVFLDKYSACDDDKHTLDAENTVVPTERTKQGLHYSSIPTSDYRSSLGHLAFSTDDDPSAHMIKAYVVKVGGQDVVSRVVRKSRLPPELRDLGKVILTGVMHRLSAASVMAPYLWLERAKAFRSELDWPEESGGRATLERIFARCREMKEPTFERQNPIDPVLNELLAPERERQHREMVGAMNRVCEFIAAARK